MTQLVENALSSLYIPPSLSLVDGRIVVKLRSAEQEGSLPYCCFQNTILLPLCSRDTSFT